VSAANILTESDAITIDKFLEMELPDNCEWHLVHGTVVSVTHPRFPHTRVQNNIQMLLQRLHEAGRVLVFSELPYELDRSNGHQADVALLAKERSDATIKAGHGIVKGAPDLVVEVMSRSNLPYDVDELERECLATGCLIFWKVVIKHRRRLDFGTPDYSIRVGRMAEGRLQHEIYQMNDLIPVDLPGISGKIAVNDIFSGVL
jgi:Uma2 family endonuclease